MNKAKHCEKAARELVGPWRDIRAGYATDAANRGRVASGGIMTTLLRVALEEGVVDGVIVSRARYDRGIGWSVDIVTDAAELEQYGKSDYFNIPVEREIKKLQGFDGRLAICALPCHVRILRQSRHPGVRALDIRLYLSLFCGHNNEPGLWRFFLARFGIAEADVMDIRVERSYLNGIIYVSLIDGSERQLPFRDFNALRSMWLFSKDMCRYCDEHLGAEADVSVGDLFVPEFRNRTIKHSVVIARTAAGSALLEAAVVGGKLVTESVDWQTVYRAQKRIIVPSTDSWSRYWANRVAGYKAARPNSGVFRFRSFFTYTLLMLASRVADSARGRRLLAHIPTAVFVVCIAVIKLVNTTLRPRLD